MRFIPHQNGMSSSATTGGADLLAAGGADSAFGAGGIPKELFCAMLFWVGLGGADGTAGA